MNMTGRGKVLWVRAKEVSGWILDFVKDDEEESDSDNEIRDEGLHDESVDKHKYETVEGESDVEEVSGTIFENEQSQAHKKKDLNIGQNDIRSEDPFNIYDLLNKKQDNIIGCSSSNDSLKYPLGFTPTVATEVQSNACNEAEMEDDECLQNIHDEKFVYAPQELTEKKMLWDYLTIVIDNWNGEVVIMGDFNEVCKQTERYGSIFNVQGVDAFNSFISAPGLEEVPLGGCSFTWCHKSATKISKLDRFLISEGLMGSCPNISAITLDCYLSDHWPILMRESHFDYGLIPFDFFNIGLKWRILINLWKEPEMKHMDCKMVVKEIISRLLEEEEFEQDIDKEEERFEGDEDSGEV
ncbi:RNA-directed DNA polymerase, eukaryota, reverse transcriptase zinc-binding domain protein [Tanacetum coccineum]|uniref:RNA-directed DNA polymerase, eukaryota, reverse transcriptase zinc-binding domain protein n=1 Tax=Tanacetum coccineum TaxID=301880 RepID=A0ABQ4XYQ1_9ASTR